MQSGYFIRPNVEYAVPWYVRKIKRSTFISTKDYRRFPHSRIVVVASCSFCKRPISKTEARKALTKKNDKGQVLGMVHFKCAHVMKKNAKGRNVPDAPTAYAVASAHRTRDDDSEEAKAARARADSEYTALHVRQEEINKQRALEEVPSGWSDYRDPLELDLDDMPKSGTAETISFNDIADSPDKD